MIPSRTWRAIPSVFLSRFIATRPGIATTSPVVGEDAVIKREQQKPKPVSNKVFQLESLNPHILEAKYAVRGELLIKAEELRRQLESNPKSLPFKEIIYCNIGNPQQLGQHPITFFRQVIALVECPWLLSNPNITSLFPRDAISRAQQLINRIGSIGAYSNTQGFDIVRQQVAEFITRRDGFPGNPDNIFLSDGASPAVQSALKILIRGPEDGIMIPIPQYPLYSASIRAFNGSQIDYYLDEDNSNWGLQIEELERSYESAKERGITPRGLVIINPGNPTGQCLPKDNMIQIVKFCVQHKLALFADEVYQENIYNLDRPFHSFKKIVMELGTEAKDLELLSFHSISKGFVGECGHRGGYVEMHNISSDVQAVFYKLASISLCPNVIGQSLVGLMVNPPKEGDESYNQYRREKDAILGSLSRRASNLVTALNTLEGVKCNPVEGAMYVFPRITLSHKAIEAAKEVGQLPDVFYAMELLKATGICVVPGSGFGQRDGTWHFRTTFLPLEEQIDQVIEKLSAFHKKFVAQYRD